MLLRLADRYNAATIIQVAYYRASTWADLELDGRHLAIPGTVLDHFRRVRNIEQIDARPKIDQSSTQVWTHCQSITAGGTLSGNSLRTVSMR